MQLKYRQIRCLSINPLGIFTCNQKARPSIQVPILDTRLTLITTLYLLVMEPIWELMKINQLPQLPQLPLRLLLHQPQLRPLRRLRYPKLSLYIPLPMRSSPNQTPPQTTEGIQS